MAFTILDDDQSPPQKGTFTILPDDKPAPIGMAANDSFLKQELANADWGTRNIAGFGTALSDLYEGGKQLLGFGDKERIHENKIIADAAPVGAIAGNAAVTAVPFGMAGNGLNAAAKVGTVMGALNPVDSNNARDIVAGKIIGAATGGATAAGGQALANAAGDFFARKAAGEAVRQSVNAPIDQTIRDAVDAGYVITPSAVNPSWFNTLREGASGKIATAQEASTRNAATTDALARKALGLADNAPLTSEAMQALRAQAYQSGYAPLARMGEMPVSPEYEQALNSIIAGRSDAARSFPGADSPDLRALIESYKPQGDRFAPAAIRDDVVNRLQSLVGDREASRIAALQESGKLQTAAAEATTRANNFVPVPGMPRVPARLSENLDRAAEYSGAVPDVNALVGQRAAQRDALSSTADALSGLSLPKASFDAGDAIQATRILRSEAQDAFRQGNTSVGLAKSKISDAIENEIERQLGAQGGNGAEMLQRFRDARTLMAKSHDIENAIIEGGGTLDARKLGAIMQRDPGRLSGELATIGAFANNFPKAVVPPNRIGGPGVSKLDIAMALAGGATGYGAEGREGGVVGTLAPLLLSKGARAQIFSKGAQAALATRSYGLSAPQVAARSLLEHAPVGSTVLGRNALAKYLSLYPAVGDVGSN